LVASGGIHRLGTLQDALAWAADLATLAPLTMATHKLALETSGSAPEAHEAVEIARAATWASDDAEEGRQAFLAKRTPNFRGE
ncbi:MAG: enoyl-CoA hydratase, partial [Ilumatobacteraceae bacterium]